MRRFLYYFPGVPGVNPRMLADRGALDRFTAAGGGLIEHGITAAPEGMGHGCIVAAGTQPPSVARRWLEGEKFHVGIEDLPPRPQDLEREIGLKGYPVKMLDGNDWRVPLIQRWDAEKNQMEPNVPQAMSLAGGRVEFKVRDEYAAIHAIASKLFGYFFDGRTVPMEELVVDAAKILSVNYRIGVEEASLLGLFDQTSLVAIVEAATDIDSLKRQANDMRLGGLQYNPPVIEEE